MYVINKDVVSIGRDPTCDVPLVHDGLASKNHAEIRKTPTDTYTISDLNSTNGTFVNGKRITKPHILEDGEVITIGKTNITFKKEVYYTLKMGK